MELVDEEYETKMMGFESDCNNGSGDPTACHHVGEFFSTVKDDWKRASRVYETNCDSKNYSASCFNLAKFYLAGKGVKQSDEKAAAYFDQACKGEHLYGCYHQALLMYSNANNAIVKHQQQQQQPSMAPNTTTTTTDTTKLSSSSSSSAKNNTTGTTVASTKPTASATSSAVPKMTVAEAQMAQKKAVELFDKTCEAGESDSCHFMAGYYLDPKNPHNRDPKMALNYLTRACEKSNHAPSCFNLAVLYKKGDTGVPADGAKFEHYKELTQSLVKRTGRVQGARTG